MAFRGAIQGERAKMTDTAGIADIFDGAVHEELSWNELNNDEVEWSVTTSQDTVPIIERNLAQRIHSDGWFKKRNGKHIASIPSVVWLSAKDAGWNLSDRKELYLFLDMHPAFATADYRPKAARSGIIIK